jgi:hypothetical protein
MITCNEKQLHEEGLPAFQLSEKIVILTQQL